MLAFPILYPTSLPVHVFALTWTVPSWPMDGSPHTYVVRLFFVTLVTRMLLCIILCFVTRATQNLALSKLNPTIYMYIYIYPGMCFLACVMYILINTLSHTSAGMLYMNTSYMCVCGTKQFLWRSPYRVLTCFRANHGPWTSRRTHTYIL